MSNNTWNSIDEVVPVRSSGQIDATDSRHPPHVETAHAAEKHVQTSSQGMTYSAVLGVLLAIGAVAVYFGLDVGSLNLTGDLTGGNNTVNITITEDGRFAPDDVEISAGQTVSIENKNKDPQVIKAKSDRDLFPVQVLFDTPYTFTVPADVAGTYVYYSETLPEEHIITFRVKSDNPTPTAADPIPVPLNIAIEEPKPVPAASPVPEPTVTTEHAEDTAAISIGTTASLHEAAPPSPPVAQALPVNPYTVDADRSNYTVPANETLHSGAPLMRTVRPRATSSTGPAGFFLLILPSLAGVALVARKYTL